MNYRLPLIAMLASATALPALADVNVYSYRQPELIQPLFGAFTAETGIPVNVVYLEEGMAERLKAEGERSPADLIFTVDISRLNEVVEEGLTQPVESEALTQNIPEQLRDPEGHWFGLTERARVVYAHKDRVAEGEVTTYEDLASDKWEGRICTRSGTHPYMVALTSAVIAHHGEEAAKEWLTGVKENLARRPQGNDRAQVRAIWAGECDISIGNTYYMGLMLKDEEQQEWANAVRLEFPEFEDGGTHVNISGVAMAANAPNREEALQLMEFLASPEGQELYAEINNEYPVAPGTEPSELVASWGEFERDDVDLIELARLRPVALRITNEVDYDAGAGS